MALLCVRSSHRVRTRARAHQPSAFVLQPISPISPISLCVDSGGSDDVASGKPVANENNRVDSSSDATVIMARYLQTTFV